MLRVFTDSRCLAHGAPPGYPERPERLERILARLASTRFRVISGCAHGGAEEAVLALHAPGYVERFRRASERGDGLLDSADNPLGEGTWEATWAAVETALAAADWVVEDDGRRAFAAVRPPGHHAERALAMGFCFFNNAAVAAEYLRRRRGIERVAIFDFDVHHGNGTQHLFERRGDVLYVSTHQYPFYPGTGAADEVGVGEGRGATVNVPLPAGTDDAGYERALEETVLPALRRFAPDLLVLSAGFDAWMRDPLGGMRVSADAFRLWSRRLSQLAGELCQGRVLSLLEGGYDLAALPDLVLAHLEGLEGT